MLCWDKYIQISNISDPNCIYMDSICCYAVGCIMFKCDMVSDSVRNHRFCSEFFLALISVWILTEIWQLFVFRLLNCKIECFDCRMQDPCGLWSFRIHLGHPRQPFFPFPAYFKLNSPHLIPAMFRFGSAKSLASLYYSGHITTPCFTSSCRFVENWTQDVAASQLRLQAQFTGRAANLVLVFGVNSLYANGSLRLRKYCLTTAPIIWKPMQMQS